MTRLLWSVVRLLSRAVRIPFQSSYLSHLPDVDPPSEADLWQDIYRRERE